MSGGWEVPRVHLREARRPRHEGPLLAQVDGFVATPRPVLRIGREAVTATKRRKQRSAEQGIGNLPGGTIGSLDARNLRRCAPVTQGGLRKIISIVIQVCTFLIMVVVGLDLTRGDFRRVTDHPGVVVGAIAGQWLLLPAIAWALVATLPLPPAIAAGLVLLAACPAGAISNYYSVIARADVALSMTLTAISITIAMLKMPLITSLGFRFLLDESVRISVPVLPMVLQLFVFLLLPTASGMWLRARYPDAVLTNMSRARRLADAAIVITVLVILIGLRQFVLANLGWAFATAVAFVVLSGGVGLGVSALLRTDHRQGQAIAIEFACRNNAIMALVGLTVLGRPELAAFALVVFLVQLPLVLGGVALTRTRRGDG
jgi:BASS family bile acid:Na+ symporter